MNAPDRFFLPDVQSAADTRRLAIQNVGVKGLRYPLQIAGAGGETMNTVATLAMTVGLPPEVKGTHMSRFVELLEGRREALSQEGMFQMLEEMLLRLDASSGRIEMSFPYFIRKSAPVSGVESLLDYDATLIIDKPEGGSSVLTLRVTAAVTSLCPCSKKISDYGAHNQRSHITLEAACARR
jgi:GTP cyclohydrolase I